MQERALLGLPLAKAVALLEAAGYCVETVETTANSFLRRPVGKEFCYARVLRVRFAGQNCELVYSQYKELSD